MRQKSRTHGADKKGRGEEREGGGYYAHNGWFFEGVQKVVRKYTDKIDFETIMAVFLRLQRCYEQNDVTPNFALKTRTHLEFINAMDRALAKLYADDSSDGWVLKTWGTYDQPTLFVEKDLEPCFADLLFRITQGRDPVSSYLRPKVVTTNPLLPEKFRENLNGVIKTENIFEKNRFQGVKLRRETKRVLKVAGNNAKQQERIIANRLLLEDAYPDLLKQSAPPSWASLRPGRLMPWEKLVAEIVARGGPTFEASALRKAASRLKLNAKGLTLTQEMFAEVSDDPTILNL